ncbi:hypothetical protein Dda_9006 [Drechslerella dactyloides]|uniref:Uncharacterized protein n=1 Tax=Drechslerella dactyloides TaxID=74499 RepID=A0AAD6ISJ2_DREDA|nr:hypothetical protein Dda_9006 [Drechslerella dactyloides]
MVLIKLGLVALLSLTGIVSAAPEFIALSGSRTSERDISKRAQCWAGVHLCWDVDLKECIRQFDSKGGQTQTFSGSHTTICSARDCRVFAFTDKDSSTVSYSAIAEGVRDIERCKWSDTSVGGSGLAYGTGSALRLEVWAP